MDGCWKAGQVCVEEIRVRAARTEEVDQLLDLWARAGENASRPPDRPDLVQRLLEHDPGAVLVAVEGDRLVGSVVAGWDGWRANLYRLAVESDRRGRGVARLLVAAAERRLTALGAERLCAMVLDDNDPARGLWSALGYAPQGEWRRWVREVPDDGGAGVTPA